MVLGRLKRQKEVRRLRCIVLTHEFLQSLDLDRVADTMCIFHRGTLRKGKNRRVFQFIAEDPGFYKGRFFTFKLCRAVCKRLAVRLQNDGCAFPPITEQWLKDQALRCLKHCRSAKKLPPKKVTMDVADTLPMPECAQPARNSDP